MLRPRVDLSGKLPAEWYGKKTASGFTYRVYKNIDGPKPKVGDYVTIHLVNRTADDSILFDSRKAGQPMRFRLERIPFEGSFEEGLTYISPGDSATFMCRLIPCTITCINERVSR